MRSLQFDAPNLFPKCRIDNPETVKFCGECGAPLTPAQGPAASPKPADFPRPGGMGRVYKVLHTKIQEKVALKLINPYVSLDPETIERSSNELKLARRVR